MEKNVLVVDTEKHVQFLFQQFAVAKVQVFMN